MDIEALQARHKKLEREISQAVFALKNEFESGTGVNISSLYIDNIDVSVMGDDCAKNQQVFKVTLDN